ncbi:MAG TPA: hypothetical protein VFX02_13425 [Gammaproteobacteria bacterium]|nr:hypothetical protein [Gammaproteobacteria bacterium]
MTAHTLTVVEDNPLPGGYRQLTLRSVAELAPGPGQYFSIAFERAVAHWPIMKSRAPDLVQALARVSLPPGTALHGSRMAGKVLQPDSEHPLIALVSSDNALACSIFAAERLRTDSRYRLAAFAQFDAAVPFRPAPSQILMPAAPPGAIAAVPLLDSWNIPSRLATPAGLNGFYQGDIRGLLECWWEGLDANLWPQVQMLGFGADSFLRNLGNWCESLRIPLRTAEIPI